MAFIPTEEHDKPQGGWINEAGEYELRIAEIESKISSTGNPMKEVTMKCVETGDAIRDRLVETEKAFWKVCIFAKACGKRIRKGDELDIDDSFIGKTVKATVKMVAGDTKSYSEIDYYHYDKDVSLFLDDAPAKQETQSSKPAQQW